MKPKHGNVSGAGSGKVSVPVVDIVNSPKVQRQVRAVRELAAALPSPQPDAGREGTALRGTVVERLRVLAKQYADRRSCDPTVLTEWLAADMLEALERRLRAAPAPREGMVSVPVEPPASIFPSKRDFDEVLFDLCRKDDYAGLYREFIKRVAAAPAGERGQR